MNKGDDNTMRQETLDLMTALLDTATKFREERGLTTYDLIGALYALAGTLTTTQINMGQEFFQKHPEMYQKVRDEVTRQQEIRRRTNGWWK